MSSFVPPRFHLDAAGGTDRGRRRPGNEDAFVAIDQLGLFAVADGVSSRPNGQMASEHALERVCTFLRADRTWPMAPNDALGLLMAAVSDANEHLHRHAQNWPNAEGPATTFAGLLVYGDHVCIAHVGDSRVHRLRQRDLEALTEDHSYAAEYVRMGASREEAERMRDARVSTRGLGLRETVDVTGRLEPVQPGDVFLACSDGLHRVVPAREIADILIEAGGADVAVERLIERANQAGGPDNITAVVVCVVGGGR